MRNSKTRTKTLKKKLNKCKNIFYAYNELQYKYGNILDEREDVLEFKYNVKIKIYQSYIRRLNIKRLKNYQMMKRILLILIIYDTIIIQGIHF